MCARVSVCSEVKSDNERETVIYNYWDRLHDIGEKLDTFSESMQDESTRTGISGCFFEDDRIIELGTSLYKVFPTKA